MNKSDIQSRLSILTESREQIMQQLQQLDTQQKQLFANINAFNGAIEECNFWLKQISDTAVEPADIGIEGAGLPVLDTVTE